MAPLKKRIHLVANAHLDPVWLWPWQEGLAEALSTFRIAADFCDQHPSFRFNHNEALLYRWVERYEPALFQRIQKLESEGRWHIAGGAYLQPDINNTSGESHIRQFLYGRHYFEEKFDSYPRAAYNFDSFGHPAGMPQILAGCGMQRYIFCRPSPGDHKLPVGCFLWTDRSGVSVISRRSDDHYHTVGNLREKLEQAAASQQEPTCTLVLWGIGNHGGGPSREDYEVIQDFSREHPEVELVESSPDAFFDELLPNDGKLPTVAGEMQHAFPGCLTSMSRLKRAHREAESAMATAERLSTLAWWWGLAPYPREDLNQSWRDLLFAQFHDILTGSCIPSAEKESLQLLAACQDRLQLIRFSALSCLVQQDPPAQGNGVPIFVANPHGFPLRRLVEVEYHLDHLASRIDDPRLAFFRDGQAVPAQRIQAEACCSGKVRARIAVLLDMKPWEVVRLDASYENGHPSSSEIPRVNRLSLRFSNSAFDLRLNPRTGLIDHLSLPGGKSLVQPGAFRPAFFDDLDHSWTCGDPSQLADWKVMAKAPGWRRPSRLFRLATRAETAQLSPPPVEKWRADSRRKAPAAIRIIESGPLLTVVEAVLVCQQSALIRQYHIGHHGSLEIRDRVFMNHRDVMLKLMTKPAFEVQHSLSEAPYSAMKRQPTALHEEQPNQRWTALVGSLEDQQAISLAVANTGSGAHSLTPKAWGLSVLRAPAYSSFNVDPDNPALNNRFLPRQDQGEHTMAWSVLPMADFDESKVSRAAQALNTPPEWCVYFPQAPDPQTKKRQEIVNTIQLDSPHAQIVALKKAEKEDALVVRIQETGGRRQRLAIRVKPFSKPFRLQLPAYQLATVSISRTKPGQPLFKQLDLVERPPPPSFTGRPSRAEPYKADISRTCLSPSRRPS